jgi:gas vesicle protein
MTRRLLFFIGGALLGMMVGSTVTLLLTPASGDAMRKGTQSRLHEMVNDARGAAATRRKELEAELDAMIGSPTTQPTRR